MDALHPVPIVAESEKDKYVVVLPCWGSPYILGIYRESGGATLKLLQTAVNGWIEPYDRKDVVVHPLFCRDPRWKIGAKLLGSGHTKVYINENGSNCCAPNMGTIVAPNRRVGGCPHLLGDVCLVVPRLGFINLKIEPATLTLVKNPKTSGEGENGCWEFDTEEEATAFEEHSKQRGWDFDADKGFCYIAPLVSE